MFKRNKFHSLGLKHHFFGKFIANFRVIKILTNPKMIKFTLKFGKLHFP